MSADGWRRLSARLVWVGLIRAATASVPGYLGLVVLGDDGPVWPRPWPGCCGWWPIWSGC